MAREQEQYAPQKEIPRPGTIFTILSSTGIWRAPTVEERGGTIQEGAGGGAAGLLLGEGKAAGSEVPSTTTQRRNAPLGHGKVGKFVCG